MAPDRFQGFPPQGLEFLRGLAAHNQREWFGPSHALQPLQPD